MEQKEAAYGLLEDRVAELEENRKTLTIEKDAATKQVAELTASKEAKETELDTVLLAGKKWKSESMCPLIYTNCICNRLFALVPLILYLERYFLLDILISY